MVCRYFMGLSPLAKSLQLAYQARACAAIPNRVLTIAFESDTVSSCLVAYLAAARRVKRALGSMGAKFTGEGEEGTGLSGETGSAGRDDMLSSDAGHDTTIEVSGAIKWFDAEKGFGFIFPYLGMPTFLLPERKS